VSFWSELGRILAPAALRGAELVIERLSKHATPQRAHYYRSMRNHDGTWTNEEQCAYCPRVDPDRTLYTQPACPGYGRQ
jgi:hypothetical protein